MKFSEHWLRKWVDPELSTSELAAQLTMAGLEVEAVQAVAAPFAGVVVGEIIALAPHAGAQHLQICQVNVGDIRPLSIVCGAPNVRVGMRAPLAIIGAQLPGDIYIEQAVLHGVESHGMLCSAAELGLGEPTGGLLELPPDTRIGEDVFAYLKLDDVTLELGLTPNRGDCLSIAGIAREVAALNRCSVKSTPLEPVVNSISDRLEITIAEPAHCPRYVGRIVTGINSGAMTPLWMVEYLRRSGMRSVSPVVDVTNYVLLELGQPLHAFDLAKLKGDINVRLARSRETLLLLDGQQVTLTEDTLVIADQHQAQAIAGIMGGMDTAISVATTALFLESAFFAPQLIAGRARRYGLHTDSSFRFERGVDPNLPRIAIERATALLLEIVGGQAGPLVEVVHAAHLPVRLPIQLRNSAIQRLLGLDIPVEQVTDILMRLGMDVVPQEHGWQITPPGYRFDIAIEVDLIEEIARLYGYDQLPTRRATVPLKMTAHSATKVDTQLMRQLLVDRGYQEIVSYSFVDPKLQRLLDPEHPPLALSNPISSDMSVMRTTLWGGLLQTLIYNQKRQQSRLRLFELGVNFISHVNELKQEKYIAGVTTGQLHPEQWGLTAHATDFYDIKADVEALTALTGAAQDFSYGGEKHPALHPGQTAMISRNGQAVGWLGTLHPAIERELGLSERVYLFELKLSALEQRQVPIFCELSKFPPLRRDIAIVVDAAVTAQTVRSCIKEIPCDFTLDLQLFDVYQGKGIDLGRKSIALGLTLQAPSRTLTDHEADAVIDRIVTKLHDELGATLRK
ncbi:MAG: phenylalanine--tRNA ligase subunit beta [Gammaproteobacteria bacterium]